MLPLWDDQPGVNEDRPGQWRLARVELVNWGTFAGHVVVDIARKGHLVTGASGSGKSSLLDAIAAVLTPDRWLRLNAAAQDGAARQSDRSLMSYVRGAWTKEARESADRATTTYLRPRATWSGVLLRYEDGQGEAAVSLARVFHAPGTRTEVGALKDARIFLRGDIGLLDLTPHVAGGIDARRMAAALPDALITTGGRHGRFHERLVRQFGFRSDITLQLLHKTQSAKNLGTLDTLFRGFMLDVPQTFERATNAVEQFTELDRAHAHVVDLRKQADALRGIDAMTAAYDDASTQVSAITRLYEALEPFTTAFKLGLARAALGPARAAFARAQATLAAADRERRTAREALASAAARLRNEGGARVELLHERIAAAEQSERTKRLARDRLAADLATIGAPVPVSAVEFSDLLTRCAVEATREVPQVPYEVRDAAAVARKRVGAIEQDLAALRRHRSNMRPELLEAREYLSSALGVPASALPFAGELISVLPEHAEWRGAIERVLAPFAIRLLVPDQHLAAARRAVEQRHLGTRLVLEAVPLDVPQARRPRDARSLVHRVSVAEGPYAAYVRLHLLADHDVACVSHPDELDDVDRGVTIRGLVKRSGRRYEKDDRFRVDDPTRWVLGGDTAHRLDALIEQLQAAEAARKEAARAEESADAERQRLLASRDVLGRAAQVSWAEVDVAGAAELVTARSQELRDLTTGSAELRRAQDAHERAAERLTATEAAHDAAAGALGVAEDAATRIARDVAVLEAAPADPVADDVAAELTARFRAERRSLSLENVDAVALTAQSGLGRERDTALRRAGVAESAFAARAAQFRAVWPAALADLSGDVADRYGYRALLEGIIARGLPTKEGEFRTLLRERSRDVVAHLLGDLRDAPALVRDRVLPVNASLGRSPFEGTDRFLEIDVKTSRAAEVEEFFAALRRIVEGNWADESTAGAEQRFAVLKEVIGRLGSKDRVDSDWRARVLDTRLHVSFLARERDGRGNIVRVYDSAEGLSGGQRQKLVVFCLAAALRYQLTDEATDVPRYGTVVLDEAFDKADSRYARSAMDVFRAFGFHMVLATPQKLLQTLEPYVGAMTSVSNPDHKDSRLANVVFTVREEEGRSP